MTLNTMIPLFIAVLSFVNSVLFTVILYRFNRINLRTAARQEHNRLLLEIDRYLLEKEDLWLIWDANRQTLGRPLTQQETHRCTLFIVFVLNIHETVFSFYDHAIRRNQEDEEHWHKWDLMLIALFKSSSIARELATDPNRASDYSSTFEVYLRQTVARAVAKP